VKAIVCPRYGSPDVLELREVDKPVVNDDDVRINVRAASVNPYDWHSMTGKPYLLRVGALRRPKHPVVGIDMSGRVEAVGKNVTRFKPGDEVFGANYGAFAEYLCAPEDRLVSKPGNLTFEQAAAVPCAGYTALQGLRDSGRIRAGQRILINGASGGVGTFAVQIAKSFGVEVTGVCSTRNADMVRSIGADHVVDYTQEDFTRGEHRYDLMLDTVGSRSLSECRRVLNANATYVSIGAKMGHWIGPFVHIAKVLLASAFGRQKMTPMLARQTQRDLVFLRELLETEKVTPVIDRTYKLDEAMEALRYQGEGHTRGKIVLVV
jgi:NADPH:quinone reductase-like Zn-dependent oxidoreductase